MLRGTVTDVRSGVVTFDLSTGRATALQIQVTANVELATRAEKSVCSRILITFSGKSTKSARPTSEEFEEDQPALDRVSRDLARTLVTDILENF